MPGGVACHIGLRSFDGRPTAVDGTVAAVGCQTSKIANGKSRFNTWNSAIVHVA